MAPEPSEPAPVARVPVAAAPSAARTRWMVLGWVGAIILGSGLVVYGLGPLLQAREQRRLIGFEKKVIGQAANEVSGFPTATAEPKPPAAGVPVAILEIGRIKLQQAVVEGVDASQTRKGPGHVPGTAGLGQPGNSVVVGRAHGFGGPFGDVGRVKKGDKILVSTTQGQSVYEVTSVRATRLRPTKAGDESSAAVPTRAATGTTAEPKETLVDDLYGATDADQLTLVTSSSGAPWNRSHARVVVAEMIGLPFAPTPQNGRSDADTGLDGDEGARAAVFLAMVVWGATLGACVLVYRHFTFRTAYVLTICPILASTLIAGETLSRVFPAWM